MSDESLIEIERAFIGTIIVWPDKSMPAAASYISNAEEFYDPLCRKIYRGQLKLFGEGKPSDRWLIYDMLADDKTVQTPAMQIHWIMEYATSTEMLVHYAQKIHDEYNKRRLKTLGHEIVADSDADDLTEKVQKRIDDINSNQTFDFTLANGSKMMSDMEDEIVYMQKNKNEFVKTGYDSLDRLMNEGFLAGELVILSARTTIGKTSFILNVLVNNLKRKIPCLLYSLEQSRRQIAKRMVTIISGVEIYKFSTDSGMTDSEKMAYMAAMADIRQFPFFIDDRSTITLFTLRAEIMKAIKSNGIKFVVIDYLTLMKLPKADRRDLAIGDVIVGLKQLAKDFQIPVMVLAQLNRQADHSGVQMSNIKDSGTVEEAADKIILLNPKSDIFQKVRDLEVIIEKNKDGEKGKKDFKFYSHLFKFQEA